MSFEARNFSDSVQEYAPEIQEESFYQPKFTYLQYGVLGKHSYVFDASKLDGLTQTDPITKVKSISRQQTVDLTPIAVEEKDVCRVNWRYSITMPEEYSDITSFPMATIGVRIVVREIPAGLAFQCSGESVRHEKDSNAWDFERPFIKDQHVRVWWYKKK